MKRTVDLSENRMFTTPEEPTELFKLLLDTLKVTKPWAKNRCNCYSMSYTPKIPWKF